MYGRTSTSVSSASRNKKMKITFREEIKTTSNITTYADLIRYIFEVAQLQYNPQVPDGVDPKYGCDNWFNFWFEDANRETYTISNEEEFQQCLKTYANLAAVKIFAVDNKGAQNEYAKQLQTSQNQ